MKKALLMSLIIAALGCQEGEDETVSYRIRVGEGIGDVNIGMRYTELREILGEPASTSVQNRIGIVNYPDSGLEVLFVSAERAAPSDDALVLAIGARAAEGVVLEGTPRPGMLREEIEATLGSTEESLGSIVYYPEGVSIEYRSEGDQEAARSVGIFAPYVYQPEPPPMRHSGGTP